MFCQIELCSPRHNNQYRHPLLEVTVRTTDPKPKFMNSENVGLTILCMFSSVVGFQLSRTLPIRVVFVLLHKTGHLASTSWLFLMNWGEMFERSLTVFLAQLSLFTCQHQVMSGMISTEGANWQLLSSLSAARFLGHHIRYIKWCIQVNRAKKPVKSHRKHSSKDIALMFHATIIGCWGLTRPSSSRQQST